MSLLNGKNGANGQSAVPDAAQGQKSGNVSAQSLETTWWKGVLGITQMCKTAQVRPESNHAIFQSQTHFAGPWRIAYHLGGEHEIQKGLLLATIPLLEMEWKVSFEFKANRYQRNLMQILHMTVGGNGAGKDAKYGDRNPAIWAHSRNGFLISSAVNGRYSYSKWFNVLPELGDWVKIEIGQEFESSDMIYSIKIGEKKVFSVKNAKPSKFENVKVFSASSWFSSADGLIRDLLVENKNPGYNFFLCRD